MKLQGSKKVQIHCVECLEISPALRVVLFEDDDGSQFMWPKDTKEIDIEWNEWHGWVVHGEETLNSYDEDGNSTDLDKVKVATIYGYCPNHGERLT